tara:strand:- start:5931 stop:6626 length:696 start_codon:yes stop_codon:yes gene_type:complete
MIVFIAGGFSTASITLTKRLEKSLGLKAHNFKAGSGIGALNIRINSIKLLKLKLQNILNKTILVNQHFFPTKNNIEILDNLFGLKNIKFIVTYRNVFDSINNLFKGRKRKNVFRMLRSNYYETYENFKSERYDINILDVLFIINFYAMWFKIEKENYIKNIQFIGFDENTKNVDLVGEKLSKYLGLDLNLDPEIKGGVYEPSTFEITDELKDLVKEYAGSFKDIDFSRVGL